VNAVGLGGGGNNPGLQPGAGSGGGGSSGIDGFRRGPDLPDASVGVAPAAGMFSESVLEPGTLTANRTLTILPFDTPPVGFIYRVIRRDLGAFTYRVVNGGPAGGGATREITFEASPLTPQGASFSWDGTNFNFLGFFYVPGGTLTVPSDPLFASPLLWLRADKQLTNVAGKASQWIDQIAGRVYSQATAGLRPTINATSVNGQPGITCGTNLFLQATTSPWAAGDPRWLVAVVKPAVSGGGQVFSTRSTTPAWIADLADFNGANTDLVLYSDAVGNASEANPFFALDGAGHCAEYYSTVGSPIGFVYDGVTKAAQSFLGNVNSVSSDTGGTNLSVVGNYFGHDGGFTGDILELIGGAGTLTTLQRLRMRGYVCQRYALPFSSVVT